MTILVTNNFLFFKLVSKFVTIVTNHFWSLKLVINEVFSCSGNILQNQCPLILLVKNSPHLDYVEVEISFFIKLL